NLACANRHVCPAWAFGLAPTPGEQRWARGDRRTGLDAGCTALSGVSLSRAVSFQLAREDIHGLDRPARRSCNLSGVDSDVGWAIESLSLLRCRLCRRHHLAFAPGLDACGCRTKAPRRLTPHRSWSAARRTRPARPIGAATGRLSCAAEKP